MVGLGHLPYNGTINLRWQRLGNFAFKYAEAEWVCTTCNKRYFLGRKYLGGKRAMFARLKTAIDYLKKRHNRGATGYPMCLLKNKPAGTARDRKS